MESATMRHRRKSFKLSRVFSTSVVGLILIDEMVRSCVLLGRRVSLQTCGRAQNGITELTLLNGRQRACRHLFGGGEIDAWEIQFLQPNHDFRPQQFLAYAVNQISESLIMRFYLLHNQTCTL